MSAETADEVAKDALAGNAAFVAVATGGVYALNDRGAAPVNDDDTPDAYTTDATTGVKKFTKPCCVIGTNIDVPRGRADEGVSDNVRVSMYAPKTYLQTREMRRLAKAVLNDQWFPLTRGRQVHFRYVGAPFRNSSDNTIKPPPSGRPFVSMESMVFEATTTSELS